MDNRSDVIKLCVSSFLEHVEAHGKIALPLDWRDVLREMDGRTHRYSERRQLRIRGKEVGALDVQINDNRRVAESRAEYGSPKPAKTQKKSRHN